MASWTPASMAVDRPPRRAKIPENRDVLKLTSDRPLTMEADTSAEEGWRETLARAYQRGNSGGQTGQWEPGSARLVQPWRCWRNSRRITASICCMESRRASFATPMRGWWHCWNWLFSSGSLSEALF